MFIRHRQLRMQLPRVEIVVTGSEGLRPRSLELGENALPPVRRFILAASIERITADCDLNHMTSLRVPLGWISNRRKTGERRPELRKVVGESMSSRVFTMPDSLDWKQAYMAAILEKDTSRIVTLIENAKAKLLTRLHELKLNNSVLCDEIEAIHDATYLLEALRTSLQYRSDSAFTEKE